MATAPTTAAAPYYSAVAATIVRLVAESATALARQKGRTMSNDLKAFVISAGGLLGVAGCALLLLWVALN